MIICFSYPTQFVVYFYLFCAVFILGKMSEINLPFQVGQIVEVKSFIKGYRGAWFRCKILDTFTRNKELNYKLEYLDYPEERIHRTKVFQKRQGSQENHLMVRPAYPPHYHESEFLKIKRGQEPLLVIHDSWQVGDLVDWWADNCYWSAKVLEVKDNEALQVELLPQPFGEGESYEASCKDLRPSLEWSLEDGWTVPSSMDGQKRQCAKLIEQKNEDQSIADSSEAVVEQSESAEQELKEDEGLLLNIMESDAVEAAVYDLEELIARIEWLKGMVSPEGAKPYWRYVDHRPSSTDM